MCILSFSDTGGAGCRNTMHFPQVPLPPHSELMCSPSLCATSRTLSGSSTIILSPDGSKITVLLFNKLACPAVSNLSSSFFYLIAEFRYLLLIRNCFTSNYVELMVSHLSCMLLSNIKYGNRCFEVFCSLNALAKYAFFV